MKERPRIVCLCGSTRFGDAFQKAQLEETLAGRIVLTIGCNMKADTEIFGHLPQDELTRIKQQLDELHLRKIDMADEVLILNVGGYIGESTHNELQYALQHGKRVRYLEVPLDRPDGVFDERETNTILNTYGQGYSGRPQDSNAESS